MLVTVYEIGIDIDWFKYITKCPRVCKHIIHWHLYTKDTNTHLYVSPSTRSPTLHFNFIVQFSCSDRTFTIIRHSKSVGIAPVCYISSVLFPFYLIQVASQHHQHRLYSLMMMLLMMNMVNLVVCILAQWIGLHINVYVYVCNVMWCDVWCALHPT